MRSSRRPWRRDVPIYITENGTFSETAGGQEKFFVEHLQWTLRAVHEKEVDVRGYFWWSLIDNYEWNHGMSLDFGAIAEAREITSDIAAKYPIAEPKD